MDSFADLSRLWVSALLVQGLGAYRPMPAMTTKESSWAFGVAWSWRKVVSRYFKAKLPIFRCAPTGLFELLGNPMKLNLSFETSHRNRRVAHHLCSDSGCSCI